MQRSRSGGKSTLARVGQQLKLHQVPEEAVAMILSTYPTSSCHGSHGTTAESVPSGGCIEGFKRPILLYHFRDCS